jgi:hypothetical protein
MNKQVSEGINSRGIERYKNEEAWLVPSDSVPGLAHIVTLHDCDCKAFEYGKGKPCKHMDRLMGFLAGEEEKPELSLLELLEASVKATARGKVKLTPEQEFDP